MALWIFSQDTKFRKIKRETKSNISLIRLSGMKYPDHNTLWRFWNDNKSSIRKLFKKSVQTAVKLDLVSMVVH